MKNIFIIISYIFSVRLHYNHWYNKYRSAKQAIITVVYGMRGTWTQGYYYPWHFLGADQEAFKEYIERKRNRNMIKTVSAANSRIPIKAMGAGPTIIEDRYKKKKKKNSETGILLLEAEERLQKPVHTPTHPCLILVFFRHVPSPVPAQALLGTHLTPHTAKLRSVR